MGPDGCWMDNKQLSREFAFIDKMIFFYFYFFTTWPRWLSVHILYKQSALDYGGFMERFLINNLEKYSKILLEMYDLLKGLASVKFANSYLKKRTSFWNSIRTNFKYFHQSHIYL